MAIFNLTNREFQDVLAVGGRGISAAGGFLQSRSATETLDANAQIAALNAQEIAQTLPIQIAGIEAEILSEFEAAQIQERQTASGLERARRQDELSRASFDSETTLNTLNRSQLEIRSGLNERLLNTTLEAISIRANERIRVLDRERRDTQADLRGRFAGGNVRVTSGSLTASEEDIDENIDASVGSIRAEEGVSLEEARIRDAISDSTIQSQTDSLAERLRQIDIERDQLAGFLEDAVFDAALESEINLRNRDINIERLEREREFLERKAAIGIESFQVQESRLKDQADDQLIPQVLGGVSFAADVISKFPTVSSKLGSLLGITEAASTAATAGGAALTGAALTGAQAAAAGQGAAALFGSGSLNAVGTGSTAVGTGSTAAITGGGGSGTLVGAGGSASSLGTGLSAAQTAATLGTAAQFASGVGATLGGTVVSGGFASAAGTLGTVGGLGGSTTAFATAATTGAATGVTAATALGVIAPPVAAILGLAALGGAFSGPGNTPAAREQAGNKVTEILTSENPTIAQLERAKALLGIPNTFSDSTPGTIANFSGVENFVNRIGGIEALSPGAREVFQLALDKRTKERATREQAASARIGDNTLVTDLRSQGFTAVQAEEILINQIGSGGE